MRTHLLLLVGLTSTQSPILLWTSHACNLNQTCSAHGARAVVHGGFISPPVCLGNMSEIGNVNSVGDGQERLLHTFTFLILEEDMDECFLSALLYFG